MKLTACNVKWYTAVIILWFWFIRSPAACENFPGFLVDKYLDTEGNEFWVGKIGQKVYRNIYLYKNYLQDNVFLNVAFFDYLYVTSVIDLLKIKVRHPVKILL